MVQNYNTAYSEFVTDKIFLLDVKQVNEVYKNSDTLSENYYIGKPTSACVNKSEYTRSDLNSGGDWYYWLRLPGCSTDRSNRVRVVASSDWALLTLTTAVSAFVPLSIWIVSM